MAGKSQKINTKLSVRELRAIFQEAGSAQLGVGKKLIGVWANARGMGNHGFYTPTVDSPSAVLEELPTFMVGIGIPKVSAGAAGNVNHVHMYVWDRGDHREVELFTPHGLTGGAFADQRLAKFVPFFTAKDPSAEVGAVR
jgi:hypothetical protein